MCVATRKSSDTAANEQQIGTQVCEAFFLSPAEKPQETQTAAANSSSLIEHRRLPETQSRESEGAFTAEIAITVVASTELAVFAGGASATTLARIVHSEAHHD